jgi:hypothetical protein
MQLIDDRSMATRLQISGSVTEADLEMYRRKLPLTPKALVNGTFEIEAGRKYSPKGLMLGRYIFIGDLEKNQWDTNNPNTTFWRCATVASFDYGNDVILDYEMFNISTLIASESIFSHQYGQNPQGPTSIEKKFEKLTTLKKHTVEVTELLKSEKYKDYYCARWKFIEKKEFLGKKNNFLKTLTFKEFERSENIDLIQEIKKLSN